MGCAGASWLKPAFTYSGSETGESKMVGWIYQKQMGAVLLASFLGTAYAGPGAAVSQTHRVLSPSPETQSALSEEKLDSLTAACNMPAVCRKAVFPSAGSDGKNSELVMAEA